MKRKFLLIIFVILCGYNYGFSQNSFYSFFGDSTHVDIGESVIETFDGGIVVAGFTNWSSWGYDGIVFKLDVNIDTIWTRTFGDTSANVQFVSGALIQLADSGLMIVFSTISQACAEDILFIRLNSDGDTLWTKRYGFNAAKTDYIHRLVETIDGGFIAVGASDRSDSITYDSRGLIIKLNSDGDTVWTKTFKNYDNTFFASIKQTQDLNFVVCGLSEDSGSVNTYHANLIKIDFAGSIIWNKFFDLPGFAAARDLEVSNDGYLIAGESTSMNEKNNFILKTDTAGNILWCKKYQFAQDISYSTYLTKCINGGYFFSGNIMDTSFVYEILLMKIDEDGIPVWSNKFSGKPWAYGNGIAGTTDGGCLITGQYSDTIISWPGVEPINHELLLIKTDSVGNVNCHQNSLPVTYDTLSVVEVILPMSFSSGLYLYPHAINVLSGYPEKYSCTTTGLSNHDKFQSAILIFPNPSSGIFNINFVNTVKKGNIELYNSTGTSIFKDNIHNAAKKDIDLKQVSNGIYFIRIFDGDDFYYRKLIVEN